MSYLFVLLLAWFLPSAQVTPDSPVPARSIQTCRGDGATADVKIQAAITSLPPTGGIIDCSDLQGTQSIASAIVINKPVRLILGAATFVTTAELSIMSDRVWIECSETTIKASTRAQNIIHWSGSHGGIMGNCVLDGSNVPGVTGLRISPANESQVKDVTFTSFNSFGPGLHIQNTEEGIVLRTGPTVSGAQSDASYNAFYSVKVLDSVRAVWLTNHPSVTSASPDTNQFYALLAYSNGTRTNTGIQIDAGSTNSFFGCSTIGMQHGTVPNSIPTAIYIKGRAVISGSDNNSNLFYGQRSEFDTRALNITSPGGYFNTFVGISGFTTAKITDNGTSTFIRESPYMDKGIWYRYSDSDGIPVIGTPYGVKLSSAGGVEVVDHSSTTKPALTVIGAAGTVNPAEYILKNTMAGENQPALRVDNGAAGGTNVFLVTSDGHTTSVGFSKYAQYQTMQNCSSTSGVCGAAAAGSVIMPAGSTQVTINTKAISANSQVFIQEDASLGTNLRVTCNTTKGRTYTILSRVDKTSFDISASAEPVRDPACLSYFIMN